MPEDKTESRIRLEGKGKIVAGIAMIAFAPFTRAAGGIMMGIGASVGIFGGIAGKAISWCCSDLDNKAYWQKKSQEARSWGTKAFFGGVTCALFPYIAGATAIVEGAYNQTGQNQYGIMPALREIASVTSGGLPQPGDPALSQDVPPPAQQSNMQHPPLNQMQPVKSISNMALVANSQNFDQAQAAYRDELRKTSENQRYVMGEPQACGDGNFKAIFVPPEYKGNEAGCPPELQVEQIFNKDMQVIEVNPGIKSTCTPPPIKTPTGFEVKRYENGKTIDCMAAAQSAQNMQNGLGQGVSPPPLPPKVQTTKQQHTR